MIPSLIAAKEFVTADHIGEGRFGLNLEVHQRLLAHRDRQWQDYATGFDAHAYMRPMNVTGVNGTTIHEVTHSKRRSSMGMLAAHAALISGVKDWGANDGLG